MNVPFSKKAQIIILPTEKDALKSLKNGEEYFKKLASASKLKFLADKDDVPENVVSAVTKGAELFMPLSELVDKDREIERLNKKKEKLEDGIKRSESKLLNDKFVSKAPEDVVNKEREKARKYREMLDTVLERIKSLK